MLCRTKELRQALDGRGKSADDVALTSGEGELASVLAAVDDESETLTRLEVLRKRVAAARSRRAPVRAAPPVPEVGPPLHLGMAVPARFTPYCVLSGRWTC
jgi:hypothetical protein